MKASNLRTGRLAPKFPSIAKAVRYYAQNKPDQLAIKFASGLSKGEALTYLELDRRALKVAGYLIENSKPGERILLPTNNESSFYSGFLGCMYAGRIGIPIQVPRIQVKLNDMGLGRFTSVIDNAGVKLILMDKSYIAPLTSKLHQLRQHFHEARFESVQSILQAQNDLGRDDLNQIDLPDSADIAFLQYTSGSTSAPKGVVLTHRCIVENQQAMVDCCRLSDESQLVSWLPLNHDMGLSNGFFMPFYLGTMSVVFSPLSVMARPKIWLQEIAKHKNVVSGGPSFVFSHCTNRISDDDVNDLDLGQWSVAFCGAEPINPTDIRSFIDKFSSTGFRETAFTPSYGLAEATVFVCAKRGSELPLVNSFDSAMMGRNEAVPAQHTGCERPVQLMSCGRPGFGIDVQVIDTNTMTPVADGVVGEIAVHSKSMGIGYWNNLVESNRTFNQTIAGQSDKPYFLTGDYGFIKDLELYISGRRKEMIIVNGVNHYPQDIERTVCQQHSAFSGHRSAVFVVWTKVKEIVLVQEVKEKLTLDAEYKYQQSVIQAVRAEHQLIINQVRIVRFGAIPKTSSGKTQRTKCAELYAHGYFDNDQKTSTASST